MLRRNANIPDVQPLHHVVQAFVDRGRAAWPDVAVSAEALAESRAELQSIAQLIRSELDLRISQFTIAGGDAVRVDGLSV